MRYLLTFDSTHASLAAQKQLAAHKPHVIPTPREISAGCGMALRFMADSDQEAFSIIRNALLEKDSYTLFQIEDKAYREITQEQ